MLNIRIKGGLGNQLFQYAAAYTLAKRLKQDLALDISFFGPRYLHKGFRLNHLCLSYCGIYQAGIKENIIKNKYLNKILRKLNWQIIPLSSNSVYLLETRSDLVPDFFTQKTANIYMDGYFQSERYFNAYRSDLLTQFTPNYPPDPSYLEWLDQIQHTNSVAVHVRRGDFLKAAHDSNPNHYLLGENYYHHALAYMQAHLPQESLFYWFSDDISWVKTHFAEKPNYRYVNLRTVHADIDELMLMKHCKHIIAANSTFSWWAAWLNENPGALKIVPARRYGNLHMIPDGWIKIPVE